MSPTATTMRLLLIDDDPALAAGLRGDLTAAGFAVDLAVDGIDGGHLGSEDCYDAIVLDLGLPRRSGLEVLADWRRRGIETPVLILTARDAWHERVDGLKAGADDYLGKPFHVEELLARLQALVRRSVGRSSALLRVGGLTLDEDRQQALLPDGRRQALTGIEFRLLRYFMHHPDKVLSKAQLLDHVYDHSAETGSNLIEVYVRRLRRKVGESRLRTLRGQGYVFPSHA